MSDTKETNQSHAHGLLSPPEEREKPWTLDSGSDAGSSRGERVGRTSIAFSENETGQQHGPIMAHLQLPRPSGHTGSEDPWLLPPESERGGTRPSSFRGVNLDDTKTFNTFVISHHKDNLIEKVEETTPLLGGPGLISRFKRSKETPSTTESDAWTRQEAGGSSDGPHQSYRISFAELQRMHLRKLQCKLVKHVADMRFRNKEPDDWEADLQAYSK